MKITVPIIFISLVHTSCEGAGLRKSNKNTGEQSKEIKYRKLNEQYNEIVASLNATYDGSCQVHVTGFGAQEPTTTVVCTQPGGDALLFAKGAVDPIPEYITTCMYGDMMKKTCNTEIITPIVKDPAQTNTNQHGGNRHLNEQYNEIVASLNATYDGSCQVHVTGLGAQEPTTTVVCTQPGGDALLFAKGAVDPIPEYITICMYGAMMKTTCNTEIITPAVNESVQETTQTQNPGGSRQ